MTYQQALDLIQDEIVANGNNEITADVLRPVLEAMLSFPNDVIGVLADLTTSDVTSIVNAINSIVSENLPNATALRKINTDGVDFNQDELAWVADAVNNTANTLGNFVCQLGQQIVFTCYVIISNDGVDVVVQKRYYRLITGAINVNSVTSSDLMPDGVSYETVSLTGDLIIDLGDIGVTTVQTAFNADPNQPFTIAGDKFIQAVQGGENKLWQWIGGDGTFGNSATLAEATWFVDLTGDVTPPLSDFVTGPASSTDNHIAVFNGTTGKIIKDGGVAVADLFKLELQVGKSSYFNVASPSVLPDINISTTYQAFITSDESVVVNFVNLPIETTGYYRRLDVVLPTTKTLTITGATQVIGTIIADGTTINRVDLYFANYETAGLRVVAVINGGASSSGVQSVTGDSVDNTDPLNPVILGFEFQTEITDASTVLSTQKGLNKVYPFNRTTAQTVQVNEDVYVENDVINIERRGQGTVEIVQGTDVRFRGVRDIDNRFFINDPNSMISLMCRGSNVFSIVGNLKRGYTGAVTTSLYTPSLAPAETRDITVTGTGFSSNMVVTITGNATLNTVTVNSNTECVLNITSTGINGDFLTITYDNGDVFVDTNAIELISIEYLDTNYAFDSGFGLFQMSGSVTYFGRVRRSSDDAETDVGFDDGKLTLNSPVSVGGDLTTWAGSDDVFVTTLYDQGSFGSDLVQATKAAQPQLLNAGALYTYDSKPFLYFDGVDDWLEAGSGNTWGGTDVTLAAIVRATPNSDNYLVNDRPDSGFNTFIMHGGTSKVFFNDGNIILDGGTYTSGTVYQKFATTDKTVGSELWIDGVSADTDSGSTVSANNYPIRMGRFITSYYEGYINHFVIWKSDEGANIIDIETLINAIV